MKRFVLLLVFVVFGGFATWLWLLTLPQIVNTQWWFYDRYGELLYTQNATQTLNQTQNPWLNEALITLEDESFYAHSGVNFKAVARATWQNVSEGEVVSGASTITMQLARLKFLSTEKRNLTYKIKQALYALKLEAHYSKPEILQQYLNLVPLGQGTVGFDSAAKHYFGKTTAQLSKGEAVALLATIPNPSAFNPSSYPASAQKRQHLVLGRLQQKKVLSEDAYQFWKTQNLVISAPQANLITAPHFVFWLQERLKKDFNLPRTQQIHVHTTLDKAAYQKSLEIIRANLERLGPEKKLTNGAVVVLDESNQLRVMVGSANFFDPNIDGAVNLATAKRQSGSTLKPFLFAQAVAESYSPLEGLLDLKTIFASGYLPRNFDILEENGVVRFREALANSYNIAAVDLLQQLEVENFYQFLSSLGINLAEPSSTYGLSLILGSAEVTLLDLTRSYSVFTHQGNLVPLQTITKIEDEHGATLWRAEPADKKNVLPKHAAEWGQHVLSDDVARWKNFSQGNSLELPFASGAKTGTSQGFKDNWVIGFSPLYTVGVWMGNADGSPMNSSSGLQGAGPVWQGIMQSLHTPEKVGTFSYQSKRKEVMVCRRPNQTECAEQVVGFVLPTDLAENLTPQAAETRRDFEIFYPGEGDVFAEGSDILIQWRGSREVDFYQNGVLTTGPIIPHLKVGAYTFEIMSHDGKAASVTINVQKIN